MSLHFGAGKGPGHLDRFGGPSTVGPFQPDAVYGADFRQQNYKGPQATNTNASGGYIDDSQGNWKFVGPNLPRISDKGLLVEGQQTNSIRNNSMQGAVAGTPGTLPTNWSWVVGSTPSAYSLAYATENGMDVVEISIPAGNAGTYYIRPENNATVAAANGQLWSFSAFGRRVSGNIQMQTIVSMRDNSGTNLGQAVSTLTTLSSVYQRLLAALTNNSASVTFEGTSIGITIDAAGGTIRIGWPQLEQWNTSVTTVGGASSPIRTTGTAATRNADVVIVAQPVTTFTMLAQTRNPNFVGPTRVIAAVSDGTNANYVRMRNSAGTPTTLLMEPAVGGTNQTQAQVTNAVPADGSRHTYAGAFAPGDVALSVDGGTTTTAVPASSPTGLNTLLIGQGTTANPWYGYIEKLQILPRRATNTELQQFSTLAA